MVFTDNIVIRSREYTDGSEYGQGSNSTSATTHIPDHYVRRLWRKPLKLVEESGESTVSITFTNKDSRDRAVLFSTSEVGNTLTVKKGSFNVQGETVASVEWAGSTAKLMDRSIMTIDNKTAAVKDLLRKSNFLSISRIFTAPDGIDYKWKRVSVGNDPAFPESQFHALYSSDSQHPIATTARLTDRDGHGSDPAYPLYLAERGLKHQAWIVATLVIVERLQQR